MTNVHRINFEQQSVEASSEPEPLSVAPTDDIDTYFVDLEAKIGPDMAKPTQPYLDSCADADRQLLLSLPSRLRRLK